MYAVVVISVQKITVMTQIAKKNIAIGMRRQLIHVDESFEPVNAKRCFQILTEEN